MAKSNDLEDRKIKNVSTTCRNSHNTLGIETVKKKMYIFMGFGQKLIDLLKFKVCEQFYKMLKYYTCITLHHLYNSKNSYLLLL